MKLLFNKTPRVPVVDMMGGRLDSGVREEDVQPARNRTMSHGNGSNRSGLSSAADEGPNWAFYI